MSFYLFCSKLHSCITNLFNQQWFCYRNILLSILLAVPFVTMIYVLMNVSYLTVMSVPDMISNECVAVVSLQKFTRLFLIIKKKFYQFMVNLFIYKYFQLFLGIWKSCTWTFKVHHSSWRSHSNIWLFTQCTIWHNQVG